MNQNQADANRQAIDTVAPLAPAARILEFWTRDYLAHFWVVTALAALLIAYLTYLFEQLPNINLKDLEALDELLPWSDPVQTKCRIPSKPTRPA